MDFLRKLWRRLRRKPHLAMVYAIIDGQVKVKINKKPA